MNRLIYQRGMAFPAPAIIKPKMRNESLQMHAGDRTYSFDANMVLSDGTVAIAASGYSQAYGADGIVDLGGNQAYTVTLPAIAATPTLTPQQARIDAVLVIDVTTGVFTGTAITSLYLVGCNNAAFTSATQQLGAMQFGAAASLGQPGGVVTPAPAAIGGSRYELLFTNEQNNVKYQFVKLYNNIANSGSLTYKAFIAVLPEP